MCYVDFMRCDFADFHDRKRGKKRAHTYIVSYTWVCLYFIDLDVVMVIDNCKRRVVFFWFCLFFFFPLITGETRRDEISGVTGVDVFDIWCG